MALVHFVFLIGIVHTVVSNKIDTALLQKLIKGEKVNALIYFGDGTKNIIEKKNLQLNRNTRKDNIESIVKELQGYADSLQTDVVTILTKRSRGIQYSQFKQFWISNSILVKDADAETLNTIAKNSDVNLIMEEPKFKIPTTKSAGNAGNNLRESTQNKSRQCKDWSGIFQGWHFKKTKRNEAWKELKGNKGKGVVVATISTGVRHTHESLRGNFRGTSYGWFDGVNGSLTPFDSHTYGTAITSIIAGSNDIGMAPESTWISCRACEGENGCTVEHVFNCLQWMICPTLPDGSNQDCNMAPQILAFSLCGDRTATDYDDIFWPISLAGIITVSPVGDEGNDKEFPGCGRTCAPSNSQWVIGVGGSTSCDRHNFHSSKGPAPDGSVKPDIVAPFDQIFAAESHGDSRYDTLFSGTSFSTSQVVGVVALLYVRDPYIKFKEAYNFLTRNANRTVKPDIYGYPTCNASFELKPNIYVGFGRLDAYATLHAQSRTLKPKPNSGYSNGGADFVSIS